MFLRKIKLKLIVIVTIFLSTPLFSENNNFEKTLTYLENLKDSSVSFIQDDNINLRMGEIYLGTNRVRVEYLDPEKILIILDNDKAMYYNYELDEDEFFDPKDTSAWFFYEIFNNPIFFVDAKFTNKDNNLTIEKAGSSNENSYHLKILFETNPMVLRKILLTLNEEELILSLFNHKENITYDKNFFKLINPTFF